MDLTWIGHACFKIETKGYSLVIDPYQDGSIPGLGPIRETANQVLCSHEHGDHAGRETVTLIPGESSLVQVEVLNGYHDDAEGTKRGPNKMFLIRDGNHAVAHLGDIGCGLTEEQKEKLKNLDAILIPVGGFFTIDGVQAADMARELNPRLVIPMHFRDDEQGFGFEMIGTVSEFAENMCSVRKLEKSEIDLSESFGAQALILKPAMAVR